MHRTIVSGSTMAVAMTTAVSGKDSLRRGSSSLPVVPGIMISRITRSAGWLRRAAIASSALAASRQLKPFRVRHLFRLLLTVFSSSTIRIFSLGGAVTMFFFLFRLGAGRPGSRRHRHPDGERGADADLAADADFTAMLHDNPVADAQAQAGALPDFLGGKEGVEYPGHDA